jgi:hypothetical protein
MKIIDLQHLKEVKEYLDTINNLALEDILWFDSSTPNAATIKRATPEQIKDWKFIGLSNKDFPEFAGLYDSKII